MPSTLTLTLVAVFISVGLLTALLTNYVLTSSSAGRRRLRYLEQPRSSGLVVAGPQSDAGGLKQMVGLSKSFKETTRLQRQLARAGYRGSTAPVVYSASGLVTPVVLAGATIMYFGFRGVGVVLAILFALVGYMAPGLWLSAQIRKRQKEITNGLPDALDLFIVCLEAGSSLDQAIVKASDEFDIAYPALAEELRTMITEMRAGKPRLEAFKSFASRTKVDEVRALVAMLVQTDRFGTSIAQALRTHAQTARAKRRQRAEEKAAKVGAKLAFPLVLCLFPALYVVILGPAVIQLIRQFIQAH